MPRPDRRATPQRATRIVHRRSLRPRRPLLSVASSRSLSDAVNMAGRAREANMAYRRAFGQNLRDLRTERGVS